MILRRRADHRRPADVDLLDRFGNRHALAGDRLLERIQIHHDQFERQNAVFGERRHVTRIVVPAQEAPVHLGMQRLHAAIHHFGKAGVVGDVADGDARLLQVLARAAGAEDFDAAGNQFANEFDEAGFVADTDQSTFDCWIHCIH